MNGTDEYFGADFQNDAQISTIKRFSIDKYYLCSLNTAVRLRNTLRQMIDFSYQTEFVLEDVRHHASWLINIADSYEVVIESLGYVFCDDDYVHSINLQHLTHDTFTDIITFDYGSNEVLEGEIYISIDRVRENAADLNQEFDQE